MTRKSLSTLMSSLAVMAVLSGAAQADKAKSAQKEGLKSNIASTHDKTRDALVSNIRG